jgi:hypothetical protein
MRLEDAASEKGDLKKKCDKIAIATRLEDAASEKP